MKTALFAVAVLALLFAAGCTSSEAARQQEIVFLEGQIADVDSDLDAVRAQAAAGIITPEAAASRERSLTVRREAILKRLDGVKAQPAGVSFWESALIAIGVALGLRGAPTGGIGGMVVSFFAAFFEKKKTPPAGGAA